MIQSTYAFTMPRNCWNKQTSPVYFTSKSVLSRNLHCETFQELWSIQLRCNSGNLRRWWKTNFLNDSAMMRDCFKSLCINLMYSKVMREVYTKHCTQFDFKSLSHGTFKFLPTLTSSEALQHNQILVPRKERQVGRRNRVAEYKNSGVG